MNAVQAALYLVAVVLLVVAAFPTGSRVSLACLGAACALLAYAEPGLAGMSG